MKKRVLSILLAAIMLLSLAACGSGETTSTAAANQAADASTNQASAGSETAEPYRVAYFNREDTDEFLNFLTSGVEELCTADSSISFTRYDAQADANNQLMQVEDALSKGVDLVILSVQDKETMITKVKECNEKGIPVICIDISMTKSDDYYFDFVGSNNYDLGYAVGKYLIENLPENGKILYLRFTPGSETSNRRHDGEMEAIADSGRTDYEILATLEFNSTIEDAMSKMEDALQVYGDDWDAFITHSDHGLYGAISAIDGAGYDSTTKLLCSINGDAMAAQMILDGRASCSVKQDQPGMINKVFELIKTYQSGATQTEGVDYYIPALVVDKTNAAEYIEE